MSRPLPRFCRFLSLTAILGALLLPFGPGGGVWAAETEPMRVLYLEGGPYTNYDGNLYGLLRGLYEAGIVAAPPGKKESRALWDNVAASPAGRLRFLADGYYSANWDEAERGRIRDAILARIREKKDVDLILAMGTWAGVDMAGADIETPVMVLSTSDPYAAGIIQSPLESGRDRVYAMVDPEGLPRQIVFFHKLFPFKRLGITFDDSPEGRTAAGLDMVEKLAPLLGYEVVSCSGRLDLPDIDEAYRRLLACHRDLADKVDAMYITSSSALEPGRIPALIEPFIRRGIPTFAQNAEDGVRQGILLDMARNDPEEEGRFVARALIQILDGTPPGRAANLFESGIAISLNMDTAKAIGWAPPFSLLLSLDRVYRGGVAYPNR